MQVNLEHLGTDYYCSFVECSIGVFCACSTGDEQQEKTPLRDEMLTFCIRRSHGMTLCKVIFVHTVPTMTFFAVKNQYLVRLFLDNWSW